MLLKLMPLLLAVGYAVVMFRLSSWRLHQQLDKTSSPLKDARLADHVARLAQALDRRSLPVFVLEEARVNGLAAADGRVFLTRGFLDLLDQGKVTAEELTSGIAHELGHVSLGHSRKRLIGFAGQNALRTMVGAVLGRLLPGVGLWLTNLLISAIAARMSREDEYEADEFATALMIKAGVPAEAQATLFDKLEALSGGAHQMRSAWLIGHPPPEARAEAVRKNITKWVG
jgi:putative metalloprotease